MANTVEVFLNSVECLETDDAGDDTLYVSAYKYKDVKGKARKYYEQWVSSPKDVDNGEFVALNHPFVFDVATEQKDAEQIGVYLAAYDVEDFKFTDDSLGNITLPLTAEFLKLHPPGTKDAPKSYFNDLAGGYGKYRLHYTLIATAVPKAKVVEGYVQKLAADLKANIARSPSEFCDETPWKFLKSLRDGEVVVKIGEILDGALWRIKNAGAVAADKSTSWKDAVTDAQVADKTSIDNAYMPWSCAACLMFTVVRESPLLYLKVIEECLYHGEFAIGGGASRVVYSAEDDLLLAPKMTDLAVFKETNNTDFYIVTDSDSVKKRYVGSGIQAVDWVTLGVLATSFDPVLCSPFGGAKEFGCDPEQPSGNSSVGDCADMARFMRAMYNLTDAEIEIKEWDLVAGGSASANQEILDTVLQFKGQLGSFLLLQVRNRTFTKFQMNDFGGGGGDDILFKTLGFDTGPGGHSDSIDSFATDLSTVDWDFEGEWINVVSAQLATSNIEGYAGMPMVNDMSGNTAYLVLQYFSRGRVRDAVIDSPSKFTVAVVRG